MNRSERRAAAQRHWQLRIALSIPLALLVASGLLLAKKPFATSLTHSHHPNLSTTSTTATASSLPLRSETNTTTASTPRKTNPTTSDQPISSPQSFTAPSRGCNMHVAENLSPLPSSPSSSTIVPGSTSLPAPTPLERPSSLSRLGQCIVLQIGDSVGDNLGYGLWGQIGNTAGLSLYLKGKASTGLSNSWYYDWPSHLADYLHQYRPHLVIISLGGNDEQGMIVNGHAQQFPSSAWRDAYLHNVLTLDRLATKAGAQVLWVGMPIMGPSGYSDGMRILNAIYADAARQTPGVTYLSQWSLFANTRGQFQSSAYVNGVYTGLRHPDGIHLTSPGQAVLGTFVAREMAAIYHVPLTPKAPAFITGW